MTNDNSLSRTQRPHRGISTIFDSWSNKLPHLRARKMKSGHPSASQQQEQLDKLVKSGTLC